MPNIINEPGYLSSDSIVVVHKRQKSVSPIKSYLKNCVNILIHLNYKTLRFNFKYLKLSDALKFPFFLKNNVLLDNLKGSVKIIGEIRPGMIRLGYGQVGHFDKRNRCIWSVEGNVVFRGGALLKFGSKIVVGKGAYLEIGDGFRISPNSAIICFWKIVFGSSCRVSWDVQVMDTDFHKIKSLDGEVLNRPREIAIGNHVWIGVRALILKGASISDDCVVSANTLVSKEIPGNHQIIAGVPGKVVKSGVTWGK